MHAEVLRLRRPYPKLFTEGAYEPVEARGERRDHVFAFARTLDTGLVIVATPRLVATLLPDPAMPPLGERVWGDTVIPVPNGSPANFRHVLTGQCIQVHRAGGTASVRAAEVFDAFPVALLSTD